MGIINVTPDSFFEESRHRGADEVLRTAEKMITEGAAILDLGGQSSRPGSTRVSVEEELGRVIGPISEIVKRFPEIFVSIDSYYSRVVVEAVNAGACIANDISAGSIDPEMWKKVAGLGVPYVLMHMKGDLSALQHPPHYEDITIEVLDFFIEKISALRRSGIPDVIIDPGFGFGKSAEHNFRLLKDLNAFAITGAPVLVGVSRKSSIARTLGVPTGETLNGTTVLNTISLMNGASLLRVHDVKEAVQAVKLWSELYPSSGSAFQ